jgi:hypothetical protein
MRRLLLLLPLAACTQQAPAPLPTAWVGSSEAQLVAALGVPSRVYEADGRRFLAYDGNGATYPAVVPSVGFGVGSVSGGWGRATGVGTGVGLSFGPFGQAGPCTTTYEVQEGRVVNGTRSGPGCG